MAYVEQEMAKGGGPADADAPAPAASPADAPRLLVVEDHPDVRGYIRDCLADRYHVEEAPDGAAGLGRARSARTSSSPT